MDKEMNNQGVPELGLRLLLVQLLRKWWLIGLVVALSGILAILISYSLVTPIYRSSAMFYANINVKTEKTPEEETTEPTETTASTDPTETEPEEEKKDAGTIAVSRDLVDSYRVILHTGETLRQLAQVSGVSYTTQQLRQMVQMVSVGGTEVFQVTVSGSDPQEVQRLAEGICEVLPRRIMEIVENTSVQIIEHPIPAAGPSAPSHMLNGFIGCYAGFLFSVVLVVVLELMHIRIHNKEDIEWCTDAPVLISVPDMRIVAREKYYGYVSRLRSFHDRGRNALVGKDTSFEASEAYRLLRTKLDVALPYSKDGFVVGVTSACNGEGKSLTAVNLAYTYALTKRRVLLLDADLRRSSMGKFLPVNKTPGLSDWLCKLCGDDDLLQLCCLDENEQGFQVIGAGSPVPNPTELLSSKRLEQLLKQLRREYDYIVIDLPSGVTSSDALVVSEQTDGILMVVRRGICRCRKLSILSDQLEYMDCRVFGVVYNCAAAEDRGGVARRYFRRSKRGYHGNYVAK